MNLLIALRADLEASVEWTASKLKAGRIFELEDLEQWLEAKKRRSLELSSLAKKLKA